MQKRVKDKNNTKDPRKARKSPVEGSRERRSRQPDQGGIKEGMANLPYETAEELERREKNWLKTRQIGFGSFVIPSTIILVMLMNSNEHVQNALWPLQHGMDGTLMKTVVYFGMWINLEVFLNVFKYYLCKHGYGMSQEDYRLIIGRRDRWTSKEILALEIRYGMYNLKKMDAIYRRSGHIIVNAWRTAYFLYVCTNQAQRLQAAILHLPVIFTIKKYAEFHSIGDFVFQGCRIRDGQYGRFNQIVVNYWAYCARIIMNIMLTARNYDEPMNQVLWALAVQPLIWGDTFGEVVGSFFGRMEFDVIGIGEINKKTVEGTLAVFVSSLVGLVLMYKLTVPDGADMFAYSYMTTFCYHAFLSMIVEVGAPRSTDNFFL